MERAEKYSFCKTALSFVYPERCDLCGCVVAPKKHVCRDCAKGLTRIPENHCFKCGRAKADCSCTSAVRLYDGVCAPFRYSGSVREGLHKWKFTGYTDSSTFFASNMVSTIKRDYNDISFDFITFIPQTKSGMEKRGYNQAKLLADIISVYLDIPVLDVLEKTFETPNQHDLAAILRSGNVLGAYEVKDGASVKNKKILLIDDILTTGSVASECAKMMLLGFAESVHVCVAAL